MNPAPTKSAISPPSKSKPTADRRRTPLRAPVAISVVRAQLADEYGELDRWHTESKPKLDRLKDLTKQIQSWYADAPADQVARLEGLKYMVDLSMREERTEVTDNAMAFDALALQMGQIKLIEALTITLKLIRAHVPETEQAKFLSKARTGTRDVSAVLKQKAA